MTILTLRTLYFEDLSVGMTEKLAKTVSSSDVVGFAEVTGDRNPIHLSEHFAARTPFGTRIAHGPLTFSIAVGLVGMSGFYGNAIVALLEIKSLKAIKPVISGDTIKVHAEVVELSPGSNPKYGTLHVNYSVRNQREEEVMNVLQIMLAKRAPEGAKHG